MIDETDSVLLSQCRDFLLSERAYSSAWDRLVESAEDGTRDAAALLVALIDSVDDCESLGVIAFEPLWELIDSRCVEGAAMLMDAIVDNAKLAQCLIAIDRYGKKVLALQQLLARTTGCDIAPDQLRPFHSESVIETAVIHHRDQGCVKITNSARHGADNDELQTARRRLSTLVLAIETASTCDEMKALASELEESLHRRETAIWVSVLRHTLLSPNFRCCLSYASLLGANETFIDILMALVIDLRETPPQDTKKEAESSLG